MNLKRDIEIELRFQIAVDLGLVIKRINRYRQNPGRNVATIFKFSFEFSSPQLICPVSLSIIT